MSKTLTVVIHNLDEEELKAWWKDVIEMAKEETGVIVEETETINMDAKVMFKHYSFIMSKLLPAIASGHVTWTADKFFNSQVGQSKQ